MKDIFTKKLSACFLVALCLVGLLPARASAWNNEGHRIVARIAAKHLSARTKAAVLALLSLDKNDSEKCFANKSLEDQMACVSTWADAVKRDPKFRNTVSQHFVDIPVYTKEAVSRYDSKLDCPNNDCFIEAVKLYRESGPNRLTGYDPKRDCPNNDCLVAAVQLYRDILLNPKESGLNRVLALKFLIHLVGDVHQPLHVATGQDIRPDEPASKSSRTDSGGTLKLVKWLGKSGDQFSCFTLHWVWDEKILEQNNPDDLAYANFLEAQLSPSNIAAFRKGEVVDWVNEAYDLAISHAYGALPKPSVDQFCVAVTGLIQYCDEYTPKGCAGAVKRYRYALDLDYYKKTLPVVDLQLTRAGIRLARLLDEIFDPPGRRGLLEPKLRKL